MPFAGAVAGRLLPWIVLAWGDGLVWTGLGAVNLVLAWRAMHRSRIGPMLKP